jgi:hypothetical protein
MTEEAEKAKLFTCFNQLSDKDKKEILKKVEDLVEREKKKAGKADKEKRD